MLGHCVAIIQASTVGVGPATKLFMGFWLTLGVT